MKTLLLALCLATVAPLSAMPAKQPPTAPAPNCETGLAPSKFSDRSIFRLKSEWTDDSGKKVQAALSPKAADSTQFVMVSIDPDRDSAAALKEFRRKLKLTGNRWTLLTGSPDSVRQLAEKIGSTTRPARKRSSHIRCSSPCSAATARSHTSRRAWEWIVATIEKLSAKSAR